MHISLFLTNAKVNQHKQYQKSLKWRLHHRSCTEQEWEIK